MCINCGSEMEGTTGTLKNPGRAHWKCECCFREIRGNQIVYDINENIKTNDFWIYPYIEEELKNYKVI